MFSACAAVLIPGLFMWLCGYLKVQFRKLCCFVANLNIGGFTRFFGANFLGEKNALVLIPTLFPSLLSHLKKLQHCVSLDSSILTHIACSPFTWLTEHIEATCCCLIN